MEQIPLVWKQEAPGWKQEVKGWKQEVTGWKQGGYRLETKEVAGWIQKRLNLQRKFPAAKNKAEKNLKNTSGHSPGPPDPI